MELTGANCREKGVYFSKIGLIGVKWGLVGVKGGTLAVALGASEIVTRGVTLHAALRNWGGDILCFAGRFIHN